MSIPDIFRVSLKGLTGNKLRAFLTLLGVVIGVGAVVAVMAIGRGSSAAITQQIQSVGTNLIFVRPGGATDTGVRGQAGSGQTLTLQDAQALVDPVAAPDVAGVAPEVNTFSVVRAGRNNTTTRVTGVTPDYSPVRNFLVVNGRFISDQDVSSRALTVVLGATVADTLFPDSDPVDQTVLISNRAFRVVGVLEKKGGTGFGSQDDTVVVPITTAMARLVNQRNTSGGQTVQTITVQASDQNRMDDAKEEIADILRTRHKIVGPDDFTLTSQDDIIQARTQVTNVLTVFLGAIAGISLLVGGIGIMNIMLVTVTERTREIGLRKAIGAKRRDIVAQFLMEATMLSFGGGGIGVGAGWGVAHLLQGMTVSGQVIETVVSPDIALLALAVSVVIGLFFGLYPAVRASRLNPIEALRYG